MTPTPKLRFVEREIQVPVEPMLNITTGKTVRILQQLWEHTEWHAEGEWRDVPLEKEE